MNAVAARLGVSRQQVYAWWSRRERNGFPAGRTTQRGQTFDFDEVLAWHKAYVPSRGGRPRGAVAERS